MDTLRVLLVDSDPKQSQRIASMLSDSNHTVLPTNGLEEASEALFVQKFDAVLLGSPVRADELAEFTITLRNLEKAQDPSIRAAVLGLSRQSSDGPPLVSLSAEHISSPEDIDGYLPENFEAAVLTDAINSLSLAVSHLNEPAMQSEADLPVLDPEKFREQVCEDTDLLIEIIDLFLADSVKQLAEMHEALATAEYGRLYRVAHTIKGSLGSIHAEMAKYHAQDLETAAKDLKEQLCRSSIAALEHDLDILKPRLLSLREFPHSN